MNRIVGVKFHREDSADFGGREYNYFDGTSGFAVGDIAIVVVRDQEKKVIVTSVDVPESKIDERIIPLLKTILKRYVPEESKEKTENTEES